MYNEQDYSIRLQKYIADAGLASRREAERLILERKVKVNGVIVTEMGVKVDGSKDVVMVNGKKISTSGKKHYIMLNKPQGYISTVKDERGRPTVMELVKEVATRVYPVGRLDYDTTGLLILTNDGDLAFKLTHPSSEVDKVYLATTKGTLTKSELAEIKSGVLIDGYKTKGAVVEFLQCDINYAKYRVTIHEGRNRQIRKMFDVVGHEVVELERVSIGRVSLGNLHTGGWRNLTPAEVAYLKEV